MENNDDLEKYFNSKEYITTIVGIDQEHTPSPEKAGKVSTLISLLTDPSNKEIREEALITLKKDNGGDVLLTAIASPESDGKKHILVAACWESEINFSKYLPFFILLALSDDYLISLEAITVIENMEGPFEKDHLTQGIKKIKEKQKSISSERLVLLNDLVVTLEEFLKK
ncbi:MAG: hypothetical protein K0S44_2426 [Bacteroidetes bacterium]|jgi:hypothetical protein|nr:hypothetical protein [Bacteroidota bacterium]